MNIRYIILIAALLTAIHYLLAGSAPPAAPANVAPQARPAPVAPSPVAPSAPVGVAPKPAPVAPVGPSPIAPIAPVAPPQSVNPNGYTFTHGTNNAYFTNGIPTAYLRNTNSVFWATNPPYGNPIDGYTNTTTGWILRRRPVPTNGSSPAPPMQR
ncbi:MAG TPA: hypothetical protein VH280_18610 [Verrucomicrobiae bacterium]|nr:hypothetical protein [Verrucomicrobiae bacterium]